MIISNCTKPEFFTQVSKASLVVTPASVEVSFSICSSLEHLENTSYCLILFYRLACFKRSREFYRPAASISLHVTVDSHCLSLSSLWVDVHLPWLQGSIQQLLGTLSRERETQLPWEREGEKRQHTKVYKNVDENISKLWRLKSKKVPVMNCEVTRDV